MILTDEVEKAFSCVYCFNLLSHLDVTAPPEFRGSLLNSINLIQDTYP